MEVWIDYTNQLPINLISVYLNNTWGKLNGNYPNWIYYFIDGISWSVDIITNKGRKIICAYGNTYKIIFICETEGLIHLKRQQTRYEIEVPRLKEARMKLIDSIISDNKNHDSAIVYYYRELDQNNLMVSSTII